MPVLCTRKMEIKEVTKCPIIQALILLKVIALPSASKLNYNSAAASNTFYMASKYTFKRSYSYITENQDQFN